MERCCVTLTDSFLEAVGALDRTDMKRVGAFIGKLLQQETPGGLHPEQVHEARDRTIRSYRVSRELRAIARVQGQDVVLLYVATHQRAYAWAERHCVECEHGSQRVRLRLRDGASEARPVKQWECVDEDELCRLFDERGLEHGLR